MQQPSKTVEFEGIGTHWIIDLYGTEPKLGYTKLTNLINQRIEVFDKTYSRFRTDSTLATLFTAAGSVNLPEDSQALFTFYEQLYGVTEGKVTPLIGDVLVNAGYDAQYSLKPHSKPKPAQLWEDVLDFDYPSLSVTKPTVIDVGAAGKGYLVDIISELLTDNGLGTFVVDAGGDMRHVSSIPVGLRVGLEHPRNPELVIGVATINNKSICCSADNRRTWAGMHHVMDPKSGKSTTEIIAVWVVADDCMTADGLATALFFCDGQKLSTYYDFEYVLVKKDLSYEVSQNCTIELFEAAL